MLRLVTLIYNKLLRVALYSPLHMETPGNNHVHEDTVQASGSGRTTLNNPHSHGDMPRSITDVITVAMESMSAVLSAINTRPSGTEPAPLGVEPQKQIPRSGKALQKTRHIESSRTPDDDMQHVHDGADLSRKRASRQAERRTWKRARAHCDFDSESDRESIEDDYDQYLINSEGDLSSAVGTATTDAVTPATDKSRSDSKQLSDRNPFIMNSVGKPFYAPDDIQHPRSAEWYPTDGVTSFVEYYIRRPMSKSARSKLKAECPRPILPNKVGQTPEVDPKIAQFLTKSKWNPRKGLESALRACQDKLLDIFGPLTKILEMTEEARALNKPLDPEELSGWIERAICISGNVNYSLSVERRKAILFKMEPKLANLALSESGKEADGLLFGDSFVKDLGQYVNTFSAIDKAQNTIRKVLYPRVSARAGRSRGRLSGRASSGSYGTQRASFQQREQLSAPRFSQSFFPSRSRPWRARGTRGSSTFRKPYGKFNSPSLFSNTCRGQTPSFFPRLGQSDFRRVGPLHGQGIPHRFSPCPGVFSCASSLGSVSGEPTVNRRRTIFPVVKKCHRTGKSPKAGLYKQRIPCSKEGGFDASGDQLENAERVCAIPSLQDGGHPFTSRFPPHRRLVSKGRPTGHLSHGPGLDLVQESLDVSLARSVLEIHMFAVWSIIGSMVLHQTPSTRSRFPSQSGCSSNCLSRRFSIYGPGQIPPRGASSDRTRLIPEFRVFDQFGKVISDSVQKDGLFRVRNRFHPRSTPFTSRQDQFHQEGNPSHACASGDIDSPISQSHRLIDVFDSGDFPSSPSLQGPSASKDPSLENRSFLCRCHCSRSRDSGRVTMVAAEYACLERARHFRKFTRRDNRLGRQQPRLGGLLPRNLDGRSMDCDGEVSTHQCAGTSGGVLCYTQYGQGQGEYLYPSAHGQHLRSQIHQSLGRDSVPGLGSPGFGVLGVLFEPQYLGSSRIPSGPRQRPRGLVFQVSQGLQRLEVVTNDLPVTSTIMGSICDRSFCFPHQQPVGHLFQLASGPGSCSDRCIPPGMASRTLLRVPSILNDPSHDPPDQIATGVGNLSVPTLVNSGVVPVSTGIVDRFSQGPSTCTRYPLRSYRDSTSLGLRRYANLGGVELVRDPGEIAGISNTTRQLLESAWAPGTRRSYRSAWVRWSSWCLERDLDPSSAPVESILSFLSLRYEDGLAYRTINCFRSAISSGHSGFNGTPAGQHVLIRRLLRGIRFSRPPRARYSSTWDVNLLLDLFSSWPENSELSLRSLSIKLVSLFCLISCKRVSDVRALDVTARSFSPSGVTFDISRRTKTSISSVFYPSFPSNKKLCPVLCLKEYELRTRAFRKPSQPELFLSLRAPHNPVSTITLARWVKWGMSEVGIDTTNFGAHSVRSASASKLFKVGCRLEDLLRTADWSCESTFRDFYFKPVDHVFTTVISQL